MPTATTPRMPDSPTWGQRLRGYRQQAGLTQGQFIEKLSQLVIEIDSQERLALEHIDIYNDASSYFSGVLDAPTLSRLEKGNRELNSRPRCIALIWGLNRLGVLTETGEANRFMELAGHGNLTDTESTTLLSPDFDDAPTPVKATQGFPASRWKLLAAALVATVALTLAAVAGWVIRDTRDNTRTGSAAASPNLRTHVLLTDELIPETGELGKDQAFVSLHEKDQKNSSDDWTRFIKLIPDDSGAYIGYQAYHLPDYIPVESITGLSLHVNYRGPDYQTAPWVWKIERSDTREWVRLGDNRDSQWWSTWSEASFSFPAGGDKFDASRYLRDRQLWILLTGNFATDTLDLDYEALVVEWTGIDSN